MATVDRPVLIIGATADIINYYDLETVYIFEHLENSDKYMVSFIDKSHFLVEEPEQVNRINHFVTAFFGYYLQERGGYTKYFSKDFVAQFDDLAWGVYKK